MKQIKVKTNKQPRQMKPGEKFLPGHTYMFSMSKFLRVGGYKGSRRNVDYLTVRSLSWAKDIVGVRFQVDTVDMRPEVPCIDSEGNKTYFFVLSDWCIELVA